MIRRRTISSDMICTTDLDGVLVRNLGAVARPDAGNIVRACCHEVSAGHEGHVPHAARMLDNLKAAAVCVPQTCCVVFAG